MQIIMSKGLNYNMLQFKKTTSSKVYFQVAKKLVLENMLLISS